MYTTDSSVTLTLLLLCFGFWKGDYKKTPTFKTLQIPTLLLFSFIITNLYTLIKKEGKKGGGMIYREVEGGAAKLNDLSLSTTSLNLWVTTSLIFYWLSMLFLVEEAKMIKTFFSYKSSRALVSLPVSTNDLPDLRQYCPKHTVSMWYWVSMWYKILLHKCGSVCAVTCTFHLYINNEQPLWKQSI